MLQGNFLYVLKRFETQRIEHFHMCSYYHYDTRGRKEQYNFRFWQFWKYCTMKSTWNNFLRKKIEMLLKARMFLLCKMFHIM